MANPVLPFSGEALQYKTKVGSKLDLPGLFYWQYTPTAATISSGTVTNDGMSLIGALQKGLTTAGTTSYGGTAAVTFSSSSGLLASFTTSSFMPTTLNYDQMPVKFTGTGTYTLPTGISEGVTYYWQWVSATTGRLATVPNGTAIAYTDAGSGTIYCQAATQYYGSPQLPAGFLQSADNLGATAAPYGLASGGCGIRWEIKGHKIGTGTNNFVTKAGLVNAAGTWVAITTGNTLAAVNAGPFPFEITGEAIIQQYGPTTANSTYTIPALIRAWQKVTVYSAEGTQTSSSPIWAKTTTIDVTAPQTLDIRYLAATPVVGEYMEPLSVAMWTLN